MMSPLKKWRKYKDLEDSVWGQKNKEPKNLFSKNPGSGKCVHPRGVFLYKRVQKP